MSALNERQLRFVELYLAQPVEKRNAGKAYVEAGYKCTNQRSADAAASQLLRNINVQQAINEAQQPIEKRVEQAIERVAEVQAKEAFTGALTAAWLVEQHRLIADFDPVNLVHPDGTPKGLHEIDTNTRRCLAQFEIVRRVELGGRGEDRQPVAEITTTKVKAWDKQKSLDWLGNLKRFAEELWDGLKEAPPPTGDTNVSIANTLTVTQRIEKYAAAFAEAARREEGRGNSSIP